MKISVYLIGEILFLIKHEHVVFPLKDIEKPIKLKDDIMKDDTQTVTVPNVMIEIKQHIDDSLQKIMTVKRGNHNWFTHAAMLHSTGYLDKNYNIKSDVYNQFIIEHIIEYLNFNQLEELLNYLYFTTNLDDIDRKLKTIIDKQLLKNEDLVGILIPKNNKPYLLIKGDTSWIRGTSEDEIDLNHEINKLKIPDDKYNDKNIVGFVTMFRNKFNIFKVKDLNGGTGARCDQSVKNESIKLLNHIIGNDTYTPDNTKLRNKIELCILQELILRNNNLITDKIWYLNPIQEIITQTVNKYETT